MIGKSYAIDAQVKIAASLTDKLSTPASGVVFDTRRGDRGLVSVLVSNSVDSPTGRFQLTFRPQSLTPDGRSWAEVISPYSLASIALWRYSNPQDAASTAAPEPLLVGLVDRPALSEDFSQAAPQRLHTIAGRSLTGILSDHRWWTHLRLLSATGEIGLPADFRDYFPERPTETLLRDEAALSSVKKTGSSQTSLDVLNVLAIDPQLLRLPIQAPVDAMKAVFRFFVTGNADAPVPSAREPFIKVIFADGVPLQQRLVFDEDRARSSFVDPGAKLLSQFLATQLPNASCWDFFRRFSDPHLQELFSDTFGSTIDNARVEVISRKRPYSGHITYGQPGALVDFSTGSRPPLRGASLFDSHYGDWWERGSETVYIDESDVIQRPNIFRDVEGRDAVYTMYCVLPAETPAGGPSVSALNWRQVIPPIIDEFPESPSFIRTYGVRPLDHSTTYIPVRTDGDKLRPDGILTRQCIAYEVLLREWHYRNPEMWRGSLVLKGRTALRAGRRLVYRGHEGTREYYIRSVQHFMSFDPPSYTTTCIVDRGWDLRPGTV